MSATTDTIRVVIPLTIRKRNGRPKILPPDDVDARNGRAQDPHVLRAIARGAKAAMMGRPWIWALAARGEPGLRNLLDTFRSELRVSMALTACTSVGEITEGVLDLRHDTRGTVDSDDVVT